MISNWANAALAAAFVVLSAPAFGSVPKVTCEGKTVYGVPVKVSINEDSEKSSDIRVDFGETLTQHFYVPVEETELGDEGAVDYYDAQLGKKIGKNRIDQVHVSKSGDGRGDGEVELGRISPQPIRLACLFD